MTDSDAVSVIVTAYNSAHYVSQAIESAYAQTLPAKEVIVVNDGSTDNTELVLRQLSARLPRTFQWVTKENSGPGGARNAGIALASGDFVAFLDADDLWARDKLDRHLEHFHAQPELTVSFTARTVVERQLSLGADRNGADRPVGVDGANASAARDAKVFRSDPQAIPAPEAVLESLMEHSVIGTASAVMVRRDAFDRVPRFNDSSSVDDWGMWLNMAASGMKFGFIPDALVEYRWHGDNLTSNHLRQLGDICEMLDTFAATSDISRSVRTNLRLRWRRAHWHLTTAIEARTAGDIGLARHHIVAAMRIDPASIRPGWLRILGLGPAPRSR